MFEIAFDAMSAWNQVIIWIGGVFCLLIAFAFIGDFIYWRVKALRVEGIISAVSTKPEKESKRTIYYPVFEYTSSGGELIECYGSAGSSNLVGKMPGTAVTLLVMPDDPTNVRRLGFFRLIIGLILGLPGLLFLYIATTQYELNRFTILVILFFIALGANKFFRSLKPKQERNRGAWEARKKVRIELDIAERVVLNNDELTRLFENQIRRTKWLKPVSLLLALALLVGAYYSGRELLDLSQNGSRIGGVVSAVVMQSPGASSDPSYYPVVRFTPGDGGTVEFQSKIGSNPPGYRSGDAVDVIYDPLQPQRAIIDRGLANWALPGILGLIGIMLLLVGLKPGKRE